MVAVHVHVVKIELHRCTSTSSGTMVLPNSLVYPKNTDLQHQFNSIDQTSCNTDAHPSTLNIYPGETLDVHICVFVSIIRCYDG